MKDDARKNAISKNFPQFSTDVLKHAQQVIDKEMKERHTKPTPTLWQAALCTMEHKTEYGEIYFECRIFHAGLSDSEIAPANGYGRTSAEAKANAELIVKAVNFHDELTGTLIDMCNYYAPNDLSGHHPLIRSVRELLNKVTA